MPLCKAALVCLIFAGSGCWHYRPNRDTATRTVVIEHPVRSGWKLTDDAVPVESSASYHRFRLAVEARKTATLLVKKYRPVSSRYEITNVTDDHIKFFLSQKMINPEVERGLRKIHRAEK